MNYTREIAGFFTGVCAVCLIIKGEYALAVAIVGPMVGFFVGERNGERKSAQKQGETDKGSD